MRLVIRISPTVPKIGTCYTLSALFVVVNAQADAQRRAEAGVHSIAIHIAVTLSGKSDISTGHHNFMIGKEANLCGNQQIKESLRGLQLMGVFCGLVSK